MHQPASPTLCETQTPLGHLLRIWKDTQIGLATVTRFKKYTEADKNLRRQNTLEHTLSVLVIASILLPRLRDFVTLDESLILRAFTVHDLGEGILKRDVVWVDKSDHQDLAEYEAFCAHFGALDKADFKESEKAFLLQFARKNPECFPAEARAFMVEIWREHRNEALMFQALETYEYLYYAIEAYEEKQNDVMITQILRNQVPRLNEFSDIIPGFRTIWTEELQTWAEVFIEEHQHVPEEKKSM